MNYISIAISYMESVSIFSTLEASWGSDAAIYRVSAPHREDNCRYYKVTEEESGDVVGMFGIYDGYHIETVVKRYGSGIYGSQILQLAITAGGKSLDTFTGNIKHYDSKYIHFKQVSFEPFNPEYLDAERPVYEDYCVMVLEDILVKHPEFKSAPTDNYSTLSIITETLGNKKINPFD